MTRALRYHIHSYKDSANICCGFSIRQALGQVIGDYDGHRPDAYSSADTNPLTSKHGTSAIAHVAKFSSLPRGGRAQEDGAVCAYLEAKIA